MDERKKRKRLYTVVCENKGQAVSDTDRFFRLSPTARRLADVPNGIIESNEGGHAHSVELFDSVLESHLQLAWYAAFEVLVEPLSWAIEVCSRLSQHKKIVNYLQPIIILETEPESNIDYEGEKKWYQVVPVELFLNVVRDLYLTESFSRIERKLIPYLDEILNEMCIRIEVSDEYKDRATPEVEGALNYFRSTPYTFDSSRTMERLTEWSNMANLRTRRNSQGHPFNPATATSEDWRTSVQLLNFSLEDGFAKGKFQNAAFVCRFAAQQILARKILNPHFLSKTSLRSVFEGLLELEGDSSEEEDDNITFQE